MCVYPPHGCLVPTGARLLELLAWVVSSRWVLGAESMSSAGSASAVHCWVLFLTPLSMNGFIVGGMRPPPPPFHGAVGQCKALCMLSICWVTEPSSLYMGWESNSCLHIWAASTVFHWANSVAKTNANSWEMYHIVNLSCQCFFMKEQCSTKEELVYIIF